MQRAAHIQERMLERSLQTKKKAYTRSRANIIFETALSCCAEMHADNFGRKGIRAGTAFMDREEGKKEAWTGGDRNIFRRMEWDAPSPTLELQTLKAGWNNCVSFG